MNDWLRLLNELKSRDSNNYLTATQCQVREKICNLLHFPCRINLFGPHGSGKTYVAWSVVKATGATHVPSPNGLEKLEPVHEILLIDNAPYHETDIRRLMATANLVGAVSIIFITNQPVGMPMHRLHLPLPKPNEVDQILASYARLGFYQQHELPNTPNIWQIMHTCI